MFRSILPALAGGALLALSAPASAQINKPAPSPAASLTQAVGLTTVHVKYSRPGVKGRKIFGGLEKWGQVWRTGANACTTIQFESNAMMAGQEVPKGTYSVFTIPNENGKWTFILNKNIELWGAGGYDPAQDLFRTEVEVQKLPMLVETMTIDFEKFHSNGADLIIAWENSKVSIPIVVDSDSLVFAEIDQKIFKAEGEITGRTYFDAAMFYIEKNKDLPQAAKWLDKSIEMAPHAFWQVYQAGELAYKMGDSDKAKRCMEATMRIAKDSPQGDYGYIAKAKEFLEKMESAEEAQ